MTYDALTPPCPGCSHEWSWAVVLSDGSIVCRECGQAWTLAELDKALHADRIRHLERQAEQ